MHFLPCGNRANETARSSRAIGVCCALTVFVLSRHWRPGECEGDRQAKVGENVTGGLQHMGALRPDLSIAALVKTEMEPNEAEVMGPSTGSVWPRFKTANSGNGLILFKNRLAQISEVCIRLEFPLIWVLLLRIDTSSLTGIT